ncbi:MAG: AsmA family protein, partial [Rhodospirillales bacterium]
MKKIVWGLSIVVLIIVGVIVVGPSMIDWNAYKDDVSQKVKVLTGRDLKISGDVQVTLFPAPTIIANDVSFSNMQGAATETMVKLERAEVRIALRTLLVGQIKVETVRLIKPIIELELAADGRKNWEIKPLDTGVKNTSRSSKKRQTKSEAEASVSSVVLDDFTIVDGTLNYRDSAHGTIERIEGLNAHVEAASLIGP